MKQRCRRLKHVFNWGRNLLCTTATPKVGFCRPSPILLYVFLLRDKEEYKIREKFLIGLTEGICKNGETRTTSDKDGDPDHCGSASTSGEAHDNHYVESSSAREAIDLIGAFLNHPNYSHKSSSVDYTGYSPHLDLSLRGSHHSNLGNEATEERHSLMHSNASAFKR